VLAVSSIRMMMIEATSTCVDEYWGHEVQVLTVPNMNMSVVWDGALCSLVEAYLCFRSSFCFHCHSPDDGGCKHLWNVSKPLPDYMAQHPRWQWSSKLVHLNKFYTCFLFLKLSDHFTQSDALCHFFNKKLVFIFVDKQ
jgi:hypothetical protein